MAKPLNKLACQTMQLYYTNSSPYANNVRMVISELDISDQIQFIESHPFENDDAFLVANPLGKVPCLLADGESIIDSEVICDFLDASFSGGRLFNTIYADWRLKSLYSMVSGLMDASVARRIEMQRIANDKGDEFWLQRHSKAITRTLAATESRLDLLPEEFTVLHINLLSCLAYLDFRHSDINWREAHPKLADFFSHFSARACFKENPFSD